MKNSRTLFTIILYSISCSLFANPIRDNLAKVEPFLVRIETIGGIEKDFIGEGTTTGFIIDQTHVLTSARNFIHEPSSILIRFPDGSKTVAKKIATDFNRMIALLEIESVPNMSFAPIFKPIEQMRLGEPCFAIGTTLSPNEPNVSSGILSGKNRVWGKAIQTDAAVGPANYGGVLIDSDGRLLGLLVPLSMTSDELSAGTETYDAGVGLAIPFSDILPIFPKLKEGKDLKPGKTGLTFKENETFVGESIVSNVATDSAAFESGIMQGDRITAVDDKPIKYVRELAIQIGRCYAGDVVKIRFVRKNPVDGTEATHEINIKLQ